MPAKSVVSITFYLDVLSSWCLIVEDALDRVRREFGAAAHIEWRISQLRDPLGYTREQLTWYYQRTNAVTGVMLNPVWLESAAQGTRFANLAAEAARALGVTDDRVRLALARGAMFDGEHVGRREVAVDVAARASNLDPAALDRAMDDASVAERIAATSAEFKALDVAVVPAFVLRNPIGDTVHLSGVWRAEALIANVATLLRDAEGYAHFGADHPAPAGAV
ncbi:MAG TPA: DsbA family protein [Candidatus Eremiobacteraceae bacterium]|nr:DsbA family protein [Candidatus Eremiobacteraceae bacterium]